MKLIEEVSTAYPTRIRQDPVFFSWDPVCAAINLCQVLLKKIVDVSKKN